MATLEMTDYARLHAAYEDANKEEQLGQRTRAESMYNAVIDECFTLLGLDTSRGLDSATDTGDRICAASTGTAHILLGSPARNAIKPNQQLAGSSVTSLSKLLALALNNRGHLQYLKVDFTEAVDDYSEALRHDDTLAVAYYNRGLIHYRLGEFAASVQDQATALRLQPDFTSAQTCLMQAQSELHAQTQSELRTKAHSKLHTQTHSELKTGPS